MNARIPDPVFTLTTGPVNCYPEVLQALGRPVLYDYDPAFLQTYERVSLKVKDAFATETMPVILQGEPVLGLEAVGVSAIAKGDVVLNLVSGVYGEGYRFWLEPHAGEYLEIRVPFNQVIDPAGARHEPILTLRHLDEHDLRPGGEAEIIADVLGDGHLALAAQRCGRHDASFESERSLLWGQS